MAPTQCSHAPIAHTHTVLSSIGTHTEVHMCVSIHTHTHTIRAIFYRRAHTHTNRAEKTCRCTRRSISLGRSAPGVFLSILKLASRASPNAVTSGPMFSFLSLH